MIHQVFFQDLGMQGKCHPTTTTIMCVHVCVCVWYVILYVSVYFCVQCSCCTWLKKIKSWFSSSWHQSVVLFFGSLCLRTVFYLVSCAPLHFTLWVFFFVCGIFCMQVMHAWILQAITLLCVCVCVWCCVLWCWCGCGGCISCVYLLFVPFWKQTQKQQQSKEPNKQKNGMHELRLFVVYSFFENKTKKSPRYLTSHHWLRYTHKLCSAVTWPQHFWVIFFSSHLTPFFFFGGGHLCSAAF